MSKFHGPFNYVPKNKDALEGLLYDGYEIATVGEYSDRMGGTFCERIDIEADLEDPSLIRTFYSVYGHVPTGGVQCIADFTKWEDAEAYYDFCVKLMESYADNRQLDGYSEQDIKDFMDRCCKAMGMEVDKEDA